MAFRKTKRGNKSMKNLIALMVTISLIGPAYALGGFSSRSGSMYRPSYVSRPSYIRPYTPPPVRAIHRYTPVRPVTAPPVRTRNVAPVQYHSSPMTNNSFFWLWLYNHNTGQWQRTNQKCDPDNVEEDQKCLPDKKKERVD